MRVCAGQIILTVADSDRCLRLYPQPVWDELRPKIEALSNMNRAALHLQRLVLGNAADLELDSAGRILIPPPLRQYARLEKKLMLIGQGKKLELWSEESWNSLLDTPPDASEMTDAMKDLSL
jgi:MraZ protein